MNRMPHLIRISQLLGRLDSFMIAENRGGEYSANEHAEYILLKILKIIFDTSSLEKMRNRFPAIDLGDSENRFSIQITSRNDLPKVKETIHKFIIHRLFESFDTNYVLIVGLSKASYSQDAIDKQIKKSFEELKNAGNLGATSIHFDVQQHIFDIYDIRQLLKEKNDDTAIIKVKQILEEQFSDEVAKSDAELKGEFKRQLRQIERYINHFEPKVAHLEIQEIKNAILESNFGEDEKNILLAKCFYFEGISLTDIDGTKIELIYEVFLKAYNLDKSTLIYQERAIKSLYFFKRNLEAKELAEKVLLKDYLNPKAWAFLKFINADLDVPKITSTNPIYRNDLIALLPKNGNLIMMETLNAIISDTILEQQLPESINRQNIYYFDTVAHYVLNIYIQNFKNDRQSTVLEYSIKLFEKIQGSIKGTDFENRLIFKISNYSYLFALYLRDKSSDVANRIVQFIQESEIIDTIRFRISELIHHFLKNHEVDKAYLLLDYLDTEQNVHYHHLKANVLSRGGKTEEAIIHYKSFIQEIKYLDSENLYPVLHSIENIYSLGNDVIGFEKTIRDKEYENENLALLAESYVMSFNPDNKIIVKNSIHYLLEQVDFIADINAKLGIAACLYRITEFESLCNLIEQGLDLQNENPLLHLYIISLNEGKIKMGKLYELLKLWRDNFSLNLKFLEIETNLARTLDDKERQEEIGKFGIKVMPENPFFRYILIYALQSQNKKPELQEYLDESLLNLNLEAMMMFHIGDICFNNQKVDLGKEIFYRALKANYSNVKIKSTYFSYLASNQYLEGLELPIIAEEDTVVRLGINEKEEVLELTKDSILTNSIAKKVIGHKVDSVIEINNLMTGKKQEIKILAILDKYRGQLALITTEVDNVSSGLNFKSIKTNGDIKNLIEVMKNEFGPDTVKREIFIEDRLSKFKKGEIGFTELLRTVFNDNPFDAYNYITSDINDGYPVVPLCNQKEIEFEDSFEFVVDFSVIMTLKKISEFGNIRFKNKPFIIPIEIINYLQFKIEELNRVGFSEMSITVRPHNFETHFYPDDYSRKKLQEITDTIKWINDNCKVDYGINGLDLKVQNPEFFRVEDPEDWYQKCVFNTMLLAGEENRIIITDDLFFFRNPLSSIPITIEYYLKKVFDGNFDEIVSWELLKRNYVGITINSKHLQRAFELDPTLSNPRAIFYKCHRNLSWQHNPNKSNFKEALRFLKYLYSLDLKLEYKRFISQNLLFPILKDIQPYEDFENDIKQISKEFQFLGLHRIHIHLDIMEVMGLLKKT